MLTEAGLEHQVLNANEVEREAEIVARAGEHGKITVATNMAGRGTDIKLAEGVAEKGGLHVICCQDNPSSRLDRQLIGRAARQGDPGSAETFRTLDTPVRRDAWASRLLRVCRKPDDDGAFALPSWLVRHWAARLQAEDEARQIRQRRRLLEQDREWERRLSFTTLHA